MSLLATGGQRLAAVSTMLGCRLSFLLNGEHLVTPTESFASEMDLMLKVHEMVVLCLSLLDTNADLFSRA